MRFLNCKCAGKKTEKRRNIYIKNDNKRNIPKKVNLKINIITVEFRWDVMKGGLKLGGNQNIFKKFGNVTFKRSVT